MDHPRTHPDRARTPVPPDHRRAVIAAPDHPPNRVVALDAWCTLKDRQQLEDGTAARIERDRLLRLLAMPSGWPGNGIDMGGGVALRPTAAPDPAPTPLSEIDAARLRALPAIRAACARVRRGKN